MATLKELTAAANDLNSLYDEKEAGWPPIKVNTKSTVASLTAGIEKVAADLGIGDLITEATAELLVELEIDLSADVKIKKEKKEKAGTPKKEKAEKVPSVRGQIIERIKQGEKDAKKLNDFSVANGKHHYKYDIVMWIKEYGK